MSEAIKQTGLDRCILLDDDREMCHVCGELPILYGIHCKRCERALMEERLDRE